MKEKKKEIKKERQIPIQSINWFTNLKHNKEPEPLELVEIYDPEKYPKYDNYNAINVDKVKQIPRNYEGAIGVPISFLNKYNPNQFEILGLTNSGFKDKDFEKYRIDLKKNHNPIINGKEIYKRIILKAKNLP